MLALALIALPGCIFPTRPPPVDDSGDTEVTEETVSVRVIGFNVESDDDTDVDVVASQIDVIQGEALWGFSEVMNTDWAETLRVAAGVDADDTEFRTVYGSTGYQDRLVIVYDGARLDLEGSYELDDINVGGTARAPLVGRFTLRENGREFLFMVNHLWRSQESSRHEQSELLQAWALDQDLPVIAVGDYNFDWDPDNGDAWHDEGYDLMTSGGAWEWVRPDELLPTQCSGDVLDFVFVAGEARDWDAESTILFPDPHYCPDVYGGSDHRPISAVFEVPAPE